MDSNLTDYRVPVSRYVSGDSVLREHIHAHVCKPLMSRLNAARRVRSLSVASSRDVHTRLNGRPTLVVHDALKRTRACINAVWPHDLPTPSAGDTLQCQWRGEMPFVLPPSQRTRPHNRTEAVAHVLQQRHITSHNLTETHVAKQPRIDVHNWSDAVPAGRGTVRRIVSHLYGHLVNNRLRYGALTNGHVYWFVQCVERRLLVSEPIACDGRHPTVMRAFAYWMSLVAAGHELKLHTSLTIKHATGRLAQTGVPHGFDLGALLHDVVGHGNTGTLFRYVDGATGNLLTIKVAGARNSPEQLRMLANEIAIYERLHAAQGDWVPRLHWYGFQGEMLIMALQCIDGTDLPGEYEAPPELQREFRGRLDQHGIWCASIAARNIVLDGAGKHWLVDMGRHRILK